jgi:hypothetical protein
MISNQHRDKTACWLPRTRPVVRCYFHLVRDGATLPDREGVEIPEEDFEQEITRIIGEIRAEDPELLEGTSGWTIQVIDDQGREVARYPL